MKPILFNTEMARMILSGEKTVTRRLIKPQFPTYRDREPGRFSKIEPYGRASFIATHEEKPAMKTILHPPYLPGDILYVRERWAQPFLPDSGEIHYYADYNHDDTVLREGPYPDSVKVSDVKWRPSIHMPKESARIFLRVTDVRAERLQEIDGKGRKAEGAKSKHGFGATYGAFVELWNSTIKPAERPLYGWLANPWVWVIEFERCERPEEG